MIHSLSSSWLEVKRTDLNAHGCHRVWRSLNNLCVAQQPRAINSTKEVTEMSFFPERVGYLCGVFSPLLVQLPRRGCFLSMFSLRHEDVFFVRSSRSLASSSPAWDTESNNIPKIQYANWDKLCLDPVQAEFYCSSKHQRDTSLQPGLSLRKHILCLPPVRGKGQIKVCVCTSVCAPCSIKDAKRWIAVPPDPLCLRPNNAMSREKPPSAGNQEHPPPSWWAPGLLSVILQSIRKGERDEVHAAWSAWDSSWHAWRPHIQSRRAARVARTAWPE